MSATYADYVIRWIPLTSIDPPAIEMRDGMDPDKLDELARDVRERGIRSPLEVHQFGERYEIIAGQRRYLAAERVGLAAVPCRVFTDRPDEILADRYLENTLREDVPPAQEAVYLDHLLEHRCGGDYQQLADYVHKSRDYVDRRLSLLRGHESVFRALEAREIGVTIAEELNRCPNVDEVNYWLYHIRRDGATLAMVHGWVDQWFLRQGAPQLDGVEPAGSAGGATAPVDDYFTCYVCQTREDINRMRPRNVHDYCELAILNRLLAKYRAGEIRL